MEEAMRTADRVKPVRACFCGFLLSVFSGWISPADDCPNLFTNPLTE